PRRGRRSEPRADLARTSAIERPIRDYRRFLRALGLPLRRIRARYRRRHRRRILESTPPLPPRLAAPPPRRASDCPALVLALSRGRPRPPRPGLLRRDRAPPLPRSLARGTAARYGKRLGAVPGREDKPRPDLRRRPGPRVLRRDRSRPPPRLRRFPVFEAVSPRPSRRRGLGKGGRVLAHRAVGEAVAELPQPRRLRFRPFARFVAVR